MRDPAKIAVVQFAAGQDKAANLATIERIFAEHWHEAESPELVVLPEAAMREFGPSDDPLAPHAEPLDGRFVKELIGLAREYTTAIVAGVFEAADDERVYNTLVAIDAVGQLVGSYRKVHLYDAFAFRESDRLIPGDAGPPGMDTLVPGLPTGLMTCYDLRFPELARSLAVRDAQVLLLPAAWVRGSLKEMHWETLVRARAIENTVYVVAAGQCGRTCIGNSMVVDPNGVTVGALGEQEAVLTVEVDPARVEAVRHVNPSLANRRYPTARFADFPAPATP